MRLAILSRSRSLHSTKRLLEEAAKLDVECVVLNPLRCELSLQTGEPKVFVYNRSVERIDAVLPRIGSSITEYGLLVVRQFEAMGIPCANGSDAILNSRNKFRALQLCAAEGIEIPHSVISRSFSDFPTALRRIGSMPVVLKLLQGAQGIGVMLGRDLSSADSILGTMLSLDKDLLIQEFIRESQGTDVRLLVIGGKVVAAMRRQAKRGEFRANIHRGGWGEQLKRIPKSYERMALAATKTVGLEIAGVDVLESEHGPKLLEINSSPGFQELEKSTGINIAEQMIRMAMKKAARGKRR